MKFVWPNKSYQNIKRLSQIIFISKFAVFIFSSFLYFSSLNPSLQSSQWTFFIPAARHRKTLYEKREGRAARKSLTLCPSCCSVIARGQTVVCWELQRPWVTASFLLWSPWERESVFPSKLSEALYHIKHGSHESASSATGNLTIAELTAYKAVCRSFNGLRFPTWPSWLRYLKSVKRLVFVFCLNS